MKMKPSETTYTLEQATALENGLFYDDDEKDDENDSTSDSEDEVQGNIDDPEEEKKQRQDLIDRIKK